MRVGRIAGLAAVASLGVGVVPGLAASLGGAGSRDLAADGSPVTTCDTDGFTPSYTTSGGAVTTVTVGGIADPACEGGVLSVVLAGSGGASVASGGPVTVPADGDTTAGSVTVPVSPNPATTTVATVHVAISGP